MKSLIISPCGKNCGECEFCSSLCDGCRGCRIIEGRVVNHET